MTIKYTTLWEILMKAFELEGFLAIGQMDSAMLVLVRAKPDSVFSEDARVSSLKFWGRVEAECNKLGLTFSAIVAEEVVNMLSQPKVKSGQLKQLTQTLTGRIIDELKQRMFLCIESDKQSLFLGENLFGSEVESAFPSAIFDIEEAGKGLALERWTAAVFHSMRILEIGLSVLARAVGVVQ